MNADQIERTLFFQEATFEVLGLMAGLFLWKLCIYAKNQRDFWIILAALGCTSDAYALKWIETNVPGETMPGNRVYDEDSICQDIYAIQRPGEEDEGIIPLDESGKYKNLIVKTYSQTYGEDVRRIIVPGNATPGWRIWYRFYSPQGEQEYRRVELVDTSGNRWFDMTGNVCEIGDDSEGDGTVDRYDNDDDNDGILDWNDPDDDDDGIEDWEDPDYAGDLDKDGVPDAQDWDDDGDGVPDILDDDIDGDGLANAIDDDDDGDGIKDHVLNGGDPDIDGDQVPNSRDDDVDGDCIPNFADPDIDGDGILNAADGDADADGKLDGGNSLYTSQPDYDDNGDLFHDHDEKLGECNCMPNAYEEPFDELGNVGQDYYLLFIELDEIGFSCDQLENPDETGSLTEHYDTWPAKSCIKYGARNGVPYRELYRVFYYEYQEEFYYGMQRKVYTYPITDTYDCDGDGLADDCDSDERCVVLGDEGIPPVQDDACAVDPCYSMSCPGWQDTCDPANPGRYSGENDDHSGLIYDWLTKTGEINVPTDYDAETRDQMLDTEVGDYNIFMPDIPVTAPADLSVDLGLGGVHEIPLGFKAGVDYGAVFPYDLADIVRKLIRLSVLGTVYFAIAFRVWRDIWEVFG